MSHRSWPSTCNERDVFEEGERILVESIETPRIPEPAELMELVWEPLPPGELSGKQRGYLKSLAHHLKPVVHIGQRGVTDQVIGEIRRQFFAHEIVKIKWADLSKDDGNKKDQARGLAARVGAHFVHLIGHNVVFYRQFEPGRPVPDHVERIQLPS